MINNIKIQLRKHYIWIKYSISRIFNYPFVNPSFIQINVTSRCNLKCRICTVYKYPSRQEQELTTDEIKDIISQADRMRINTVVFSGGEPLLRRDLFEIFKFINENTKMKIIITTNGTLIDEDMAAKIVGVGVSNLQISLDGALEKTHDYIRGEGTFKKTTEAIRILNQIKTPNLSVGLSFTITTFNYLEMVKFLNLCRELVVDHILFIPFIEDNTYVHKDHSLNNFLLDEKKISSFKSILEKILLFKEKYVKPVISNFENLALYEKYFTGELNNHHWQCFAGFHWIQINDNGDMRMCAWKYGDIRSNKVLKKIWYSKDALRARIKIKKCKQLCLQPCMTKP